MKRIVVVACIFLLWCATVFADTNERWTTYNGAAVHTTEDIVFMTNKEAIEGGDAIVLAINGDGVRAFSLTITLSEEQDFSLDTNNKMVIMGNFADSSTWYIYSADVFEQEDKKISIIFYNDTAEDLIYEAAFYSDLYFQDFMLIGTSGTALIVRVNTKNMYRYI